MKVGIQNENKLSGSGKTAMRKFSQCSELLASN